MNPGKSRAENARCQSGFILFLPEIHVLLHNKSQTNIDFIEFCLYQGQRKR